MNKNKEIAEEIAKRAELNPLQNDTIIDILDKHYPPSVILSTKTIVQLMTEKPYKVVATHPFLYQPLDNLRDIINDSGEITTP